MDFNYRSKYDINDLLRIMEILRSEQGCPWDREQTHESIRKNFIEETYEVCEAIDNADAELLKEELGDVLLQIVFHAQLESEGSSFDFSDVCDGICKKLIERHPHVFSDVNVENAEQVLVNWDKIKQKSKGQKTYGQTLDSVPKVLPSLMRAQKVLQRAAKSGLDFDSASEALSNLESRVADLKSAVAQKNEQDITRRLGDMLLSSAAVSRKLSADGEYALGEAISRFVENFKKFESLSLKENIELKSAEPGTVDKLWKSAGH